MLVAVLAASVAAALAMPRSPALAGASRTVAAASVAVGTVGVVALLAVSTPRVAALALVALGVLAATGLLVRRRRAPSGRAAGGRAGARDLRAAGRRARLRPAARSVAGPRRAELASPAPGRRGRRARG